METQKIKKLLGAISKEAKWEKPDGEQILANVYGILELLEPTKIDYDKMTKAEIMKVITPEQIETIKANTHEGQSTVAYMVFECANNSCQAVVWHFIKDLVS